MLEVLVQCVLSKRLVPKALCCGNAPTPNTPRLKMGMASP